MDDSSEPVQVFIRIRPELVDSTINNSKNHSHESCIGVLDEKNLKVMPPDGVYGARKSVSAMDDKLFSFDQIFPETTSQEELYQSVSAHVLATVRGYNTTIFAYGTTGSGKSYTMTGNKAAPGIIPRAIGDIFRHIENTAAQEQDVFFYIRLSYVELYNNQFRNLLENVASTKDSSSVTSNSHPFRNEHSSISGFYGDYDDLDHSAFESQYGPTFSAARSKSSFPVPAHPGFAHRTDKIEVRESASAGVFLAGPNLRVPVTSAQEAFQLIAKGNKVRATGSTQCNDVSSRSHAILTFHVESRVSAAASTGNLLESTTSSLTSTMMNNKTELRLGKIHLVDLAGSERVALSGAEGDTLLETQNINLSLTALGDVLSALSKNASILIQQQKAQLASGSQSKGLLSPGKVLPTLVPVPYRNSKLTHLLKDSLGGNSKTIMITTIRTSSEYYQQTLISLMYSSRAKKVRNRSLVNKNVIGDTGIHAVTNEIDRLKKSLDDRTTEFERLKLLQMKDAKENLALKGRLTELKDANEKEKKLLEAQISQVIHSQAGQINSQRHKISVLQSALQDELTMSQNRIAEQEKEIKWLKKALDETSQAAQQPQDQLNRMQKVVDAWQTQAKGAQSELSIVLKQAEELKSLNSILNLKIVDIESNKKILQEELHERNNESEDLVSAVNKLSKEKRLIDEQLVSKDSIIADLQRKIQELQAVNNSLTASQEQLMSLNEQLNSKNKMLLLKNSKYQTRISELEQDKSDLTIRLNTLLNELELKTSSTIENASQQLNKKDSLLSMTNQELTRIQQEYYQYKQQKEEEEELLNEKIILLREENNKILSDKSKFELLLQEKSKSEKYNDEQIEKLNEIESINNKLIQDKKSFEISKEKEMNDLMNECEKIVKELKTKLSKESEFYQQKLDKIEKDHLHTLDEMKRDFQKKEDSFRKHMSTAENKVKDVIESEIGEAIVKLEKQHSDEIKALEESYQLKLEETLTKQLNELNNRSAKEIERMKRDLEREKSKLINDLAEKYQIELDEAISKNNDALVEKAKQNFADYKAKVDKEYHDKCVELSNKAKDQDKQYDLLLAEMKKKSDEEIILLTQKERIKLTEKYQREIEELKKEMEDLISKSKKEKNDLEKQLHKLMDERIISSEEELEMKHELNIKELKKSYEIILNESLQKQKNELNILQKQEIDLLTNQLSKQFNNKVNAIQSSQTQELDLLMKKHLEQLDSSKKEKDTHYHKLLDEQDKIIQSLKNDMMKLQSQYKSDVYSSLNKQQEELLEKHRIECDTLRNDKHELEARHQQEMREEQSKHIEDIAAQRKQLHNQHAKAIALLNEELTNAKEKYAESIALSHSKQGEEQKILLDQRAKFDEQMRNMIAERDKLSLEEHSNLKQVHEQEKSRLLATIEKLKIHFENEKKQLQIEYKEEMDRFANKSQEKHTKELNDLREDCEEQLKLQASSLNGKFKVDLEQLRNDYNETEEQLTSALKESEIQLNELTEKYNKEKNLFQENHTQLADELNKELENMSKKYKSEFQTLKKTVKKLENHLEENKIKLEESEQQKKDLQLLHANEIQLNESNYRKEINDLKKNFEKDLKLQLFAKDEIIDGLKEELLGLQLQNREDLHESLNKQQQEWMERQRIDQEKMRIEKQEMEKRHQEDMSEALAKHLSDVASQRKQLESTHNKLINNLQEELAMAKERYNEVIHSSALQQGQEAKLLIEQRSKLEESMKSILNERENQYKNELQDLEHNFEEEKIKKQNLYDKMKNRLENEIINIQQEHKEELIFLNNQNKEKLKKELHDLQLLLEEKYKNDIINQQKKYSHEIDLLKGANNEQMNELISHKEEQILSLREQFIKQENSNKEKVAELMKSHEIQLNNMINKLENEAKESESILLNKINSLSNDYIYKINLLNEQLKLKDEIMGENNRLLIDQFEQNKSEIINEYNEKEIILQKQLDELMNKHNQNTNLLNEEIKLSNEYFEQEKENLIKSYENKILLLQQNNNIYLNELEVKLKYDYSIIIKNIENEKNEIEIEYNSKIHNLQQELLEKDDIIQQENDSKKQILYNTNQSHQLQIKELNEQYTSHVKELQSQQNIIIESTKENYENELNELKNQHMNERMKINEDKKQEFINIRNEMNEKYKKEKQSIIDSYESSLNQNQQNTANEVMDLMNEKDELLRQLNQIQLTSEAAINKLHEEIEDTSSELKKEKAFQQLLKDNHSLQITKIEQQNEEKLYNIKQELDKIYNDNINQSKNDIINDYESKIKIINEQFSFNMSKKVEEIKALYDEESRIQQEESMKLIQNEKQKSNELEKQLNKLINEKEEIEAYINKLEKKLKENQKIHDNNNQQLQSQENDLKKLNELLSLTTQNLKQQLEDLKEQHLLDTNDQLERLINEHQEEISSLEYQINQIKQNESSKNTQILQEFKSYREKYDKMMNELQEKYDNDIYSLNNQLITNDDKNKELLRQINKNDMIKDLLKTEIENLKKERNDYLDQINKLEMEIISNHNKNKIESEIMNEKEKLTIMYDNKINMLLNEKKNNEEELNKIMKNNSQLEIDCSSLRTMIKYNEDEKNKNELFYKNLLYEKEIEYEKKLKYELSNQYEQLQGGYLKLIQQQVDSLMKIVQNNNQNNNHVDVQDLPELWKQKHGVFPASDLMSISQPSSSSVTGSNASGPGPIHSALYSMPANEPTSFHNKSNNNRLTGQTPYPRNTPIHILSESIEYKNDTKNNDFVLQNNDSIPRPKTSISSSSLSISTNQYNNSNNNGVSKSGLPWSSPSLRSSPTDQLIAAILDGDVQGIRAVVRTKGDDLNSEFWKDLTRTVLPIHRAIAGLHFHGSDKLLIATIEVLVQLGTDINMTDHAGNNVLHKAIQVCTSKSVSAVVTTLLNKGANPKRKNKDGDTPLHSECKRVRTASVEVIESLINAGADPNSKNNQYSNITPLTLVLLRGASTTGVGVSLLGIADDMISNGQTASNNILVKGIDTSLDAEISAEILEYEGRYGRQTYHGKSSNIRSNAINGFQNHNNYFTPVQNQSSHDSYDYGATSGNSTNNNDTERSRIAGRRVWIKAADVLIRMGADWDPYWITPRGSSQLHLLLSGFPPTREESLLYQSLITDALSQFHQPRNANPSNNSNNNMYSLSLIDENDRTSLFILCEQMATISYEYCPDAPKIMKLLLDLPRPKNNNNNINNINNNNNSLYLLSLKNWIEKADRTGRTIFDIEEKVPHSCLSICKPILYDIIKSNNINNNRLGLGYDQTSLVSNSHDSQQSWAKVPSAVITRSINNNNNNNNNLFGESERKAYTGNMNTNQNRAKNNSNEEKYSLNKLGMRSISQRNNEL
eukprot:gene6383-8793_t